MPKTDLEKIFDAGIVGAGGAGFPTHIKINNKAAVVIANGVECEPLLRVDRQIMELYPEKIIEGMQIVMNITGAERGIICLKEKYHYAVERLAAALKSKNKIELKLIGNYYPAGDEQQIVYEVTGRVVSCGGLPIDAGAVVCNVLTLANIADAIYGIPVTERVVTVTGEVVRPITLSVPIGTPIERIVEVAGIKREREECTIIAGGPVMGKIETDWRAPVTKTLGGVVVLASNHTLIVKKKSPLDKDYRIARSVCCQCNFCTDLCPRNSLGLKVEPHKVMRAINYDGVGSYDNINNIFSCCDCGICTLYACNMNLSPSKFMTSIKTSMQKKGIKPIKNTSFGIDPMREFRKVPTKRFVERLGLTVYDLDAPFIVQEVKADVVSIPLKQHIGFPAIPVVKAEQTVKKGDLIGNMENGKIGAKVHSSISGTVSEVNEMYINITAG